MKQNDCNDSPEDRSHLRTTILNNDNNQNIVDSVNWFVPQTQSQH